MSGYAHWTGDFPQKNFTQALRYKVLIRQLSRSCVKSEKCFKLKIQLSNSRSESKADAGSYWILNGIVHHSNRTDGSNPIPLMWANTWFADPSGPTTVMSSVDRWNTNDTCWIPSVALLTGNGLSRSDAEGWSMSSILQGTDRSHSEGWRYPRRTGRPDRWAYRQCSTAPCKPCTGSRRIRYARRRPT